MRQTLLLLGLCTLTWTWDDPTPPAGFALYTSLTPGSYTQGPAWIGNGLTATCEDLGLVADGKPHYFIARALLGTTGAMTLPSNEVSKVLASTIPPPPPPPPRICLKFNPKGKCVKWG